jgi:hypothetical protein
VSTRPGHTASALTVKTDLPDKCPISCVLRRRIVPGRRNRTHEKQNFVSIFNIVFRSLARLKDFPSVFRKIVLHSRDPASTRGACASSRTRGGLRWTLATSTDEWCWKRLRSRVVLAPLGWCQACRRPAGDGDYEVTETGESTRISVNTIAQGRPDCFGGPVVTNSYAFFHCIRGCGCAKHPVFPAPSVFERDKDDAKLGRKCAARMQSCVSDLFAAHPSRRRAKARLLRMGSEDTASI